MLPFVRSNRNTPSLFDEFFGKDVWNDFFEKSGWNSSPNVNVYDKKDHYEIELAAPGLDKKDFHIDLKDNLLTISSEKQEEKKEEKDSKVVFCEFNYSKFSRSFQLPDGVDANKIEANHKNGVLTVSLPKREEYKSHEPRMIEIH
ncbi:Hsp20/alpha crystallin family protein [Mangrovibacterium diazotrophicum]|uniref:Heat shock protein Hsp20 n=1 Tax=Mangrovibacterium diazotrophicum TaxID=1261403 RepID=A0A419W758_9BACT|nr:Hsp20/alpha crystallin family protein [Mangrovibacterium diazotrophicum]RKD91285.1 heat shock protein Hsp20 [Mangrovibacterium diazotrophicum]